MVAEVELALQTRHHAVSNLALEILEADSDRTIHQCFMRQAHARPDAIALVSGSEQVTYRELDQQSDRIASALLARGISLGQPVGLLIPRSIEMIATMLGVLKAGGAYVPFDPHDPPERLALLLSEAGIDFVVMKDEPVFVLPVKRRLLLNSTIADQAGELDVGVEEGDPAYIMFTSGSTGRPKAVEIPHRGVVRLVSGDYVRFGPDRVFLHLSPPAFDASTFEIWGALLNGGRSVLYPERLPTLSGLRAAIESQRVTTLWLTAALFNTIIDGEPAILDSVEELLTGGEALSFPHVKRALELLPNTQLINGYGPTECTTFTCCYRIPKDFGRSQPNAPARVETSRDSLGPALPAESGDSTAVRSVPIGTPIRETEVFLLDDHLQPVPQGAVGELCIGGSGLALRYRNRPDLTAEKFVEHPTRKIRLYRSGDLARLRDDGNLDFVGRSDNQVKINGRRIEPGEIEFVLGEQSEVAQAAVVVNSSGPLGKRHLVAFVVLRPEHSDVPVTVLREKLCDRLPEYMIPNPIVALASLPLTPNGKVDRKALQSYALPVRSMSDEESAARSPLEAQIAKRMAEVLAVPAVGRSEDLFALGGDSLTAVQLIAWLEAEYGAAVGSAQSLTPASMAAAIERESKFARGLVLFKDGPSEKVPLFVAHGIDGYAPLYRGLLEGITNPVYGLTLSEGDPAESMESIAANHITKIRRIVPAGPYQICGHSFGGTLAFEIARQLRAAGCDVSHLILLDASTVGIQVAWTRQELRAQLTRRICTRLTILKKGSAREIWSYFTSRAETLGRALIRRTPVAGLILREEVARAVPTKRQEMASRLFDVMARYSPAPYEGDVTLIRARDFYSGDGNFDPQNGWGKLVEGRLRIFNAAGDHLTMLKSPNIEAVGRVIEEILSA